jgi:hypothetical protein
MILKVIIRYCSNKEPLWKLFHHTSVDYKDDIQVLQDTVLDCISKSLKLIHDGGKFVIDLSAQSSELSFL